MKKILIMLIVCLTAVIPIAAQGTDGIVWDFCVEQDANKWMPSGGDATVETGVYLLTSRTNDVQLANHLDEESFDAAEYPYFAIKYKATTTFTQGALFFVNEKASTFTADLVIKYPITANSKWVCSVIDCRVYEKYEDSWNGNITSLRFDPINNSDDKSYIYISRIGFFKDKQSAEQYLASAPEEQKFDKLTFFRDHFQCSYVPANTLSDGYDKAKYMLADTSVKGNVVMYRDKNGEERVLPLSHVNNHGFSTFSPHVAADYYIGTRTKTFGDITHHWAKEQIEYVSARELFGGTGEDEFSPDMPITKGMFITVFGRMCGVNGTTDGMYYEPFVKWADEKGYCSMDGFDAESGMTRLEMARIIDKFISDCGYSIRKEEYEEFEDISVLSEADRNAVNNVRSYGIIMGKTDGAFDPDGLLTRAESATVMMRLIKQILGVNIQSPYTADYFRRDRIKLGTKGSFEPFYVQDEEYMQRVLDCGFDWIVATSSVSAGDIRESLLDFADKNGVEIYLYDQAHKNAAWSAEYADHPSYTGTYIYDEPGTDEMASIAETANKYLAETGRDPHVNLLPLYASDAQLKYGAGTKLEYTSDDHSEFYYNYAKTWGELADADFMCVDIYPLNKTGTYKDYVESINLFSRAARDTNKEFYAYIQAYGWASSKRHASLRDFRFQAYSMLSFGCKGLIYWSYTSQFDYSTYSLVDRDGKPTEIYYAAQTSLKELKKLSDIYCKYENYGAFTHNCTDDTPYLKMTNPASFPAIKQIVSEQPLLIGCFEEKEGDGKAFTVVNMTEPLDNLSATAKFSLNGYTTVTAYVKGEPVILAPDNDGFYTLTLETGEGAFITIE